MDKNEDPEDIKTRAIDTLEDCTTVFQIYG